MKDNLSKIEIAEIAYKTFAIQFKTLQMATVAKDGTPSASYSPYVKVGDNFYVYVSELSTHTKNLTATNLASIFFVQNEDEAKHLFVRRRLSYTCNTAEVERSSVVFKLVMDDFSIKFGDKFIGMIRELEDFHLFELTPYSGIFVNGFGQAFDTAGEGMSELKHKNDVGHRSSNKNTKEQMEASAD